MAFSDRSTHVQLARLRPVALRLLKQYGFAPSEFRVLNHAYNTTYAVVTPAGQRFALRLNTNSQRSREEMTAETAWIWALGKTYNKSTVPGTPYFPVPQRTTDGTTIASEFALPLGREVRAVLYSWLPGAAPGKNTYEHVAHAMGSALLHMHRHAASYEFPEGAKLKPLENSLFNREFELAKHAPDIDHPLMKRVAEDADRVMQREMRKRLMPVHYDLHTGNVKWYKGRLSVFDFDDCMMGRPILDVAITVFYLRRYGPAVETAFWQGFSGTKEAALGANSMTDLEFETLVASRGVALANELFRMDTRSLREMAPGYARATAARIKHFSETGVFDPSLTDSQDPAIAKSAM